MVNYAHSNTRGILLVIVVMSRLLDLFCFLKGVHSTVECENPLENGTRASSAVLDSNYL